MTDDYLSPAACRLLDALYARTLPTADLLRARVWPMTFRLRYVAGSHYAHRFPSLTYPMRGRPPYRTRERAEIVRQAMPDPSKFEIVEED